MRLSQLHYFVEVCKHDNITRAAEKLCVSQPTVTTAIRDLEKELGVFLFHRIKQRVFLTDEGRYFLKELEPLLFNLRKLTGNMADLGEKKNLIKIGIPPMAGSFLFPKIFFGFREKYPDIKIEIAEYSAPEVQKAVMNETLDFGVMIKENLLSREIDYTEITRTNFKFFTYHDHELAKKKSISFNELKGVPLILFDEKFYVNRVVNEGFALIKSAPDIILLTSQINTVKRFVQEKIASTFLIEDCVLSQDGMKGIPLENSPPVTLVLGRKASRCLYSNAGQFIQYVKNLYSV